MSQSEPDQRPHETRERVLDTAERLFMEHGFDGTPTRLVTSAAGVNIAAVNYHFGSKRALMEAVLRRRLEVLNRARMQALDEFEARAGGRPLKPSEIIDAFFGTMLRLADDESSGWRTFLRLLGRSSNDPAAFIQTLLAAEYAPVLERYKAALFKALPQVPRVEIVWRFHFMLGAISYALAGDDALQLVTDWGVESDDVAADDARLWPRLMSFLLGGLRAPLPSYADTKTGEEPRDKAAPLRRVVP